ncbi:hypothetical protein [Niabella hirudinis]|uniref:hypothetical protein n=1 Tax=Niabella hirudinis TaxID=1285929 RepID=UPI003EB87262
MKTNFDIELLPEAIEFLDNLDDKTSGKETLVVATHGILKKTQKTPPKEIKKAEEIRKQYLNNKTNK